MIQYLKEHQRDFMPEDTKAGMIQAYLDRYTGSAVLDLFQVDIQNGLRHFDFVQHFQYRHGRV